MLEPTLPMLAVLLSSLALIGLGVMAFVIFKRLPKPKNKAIQQSLLPSEQDLIAEPGEVIPPIQRWPPKI